MKSLFIILVLANLLLWSAWQGWLGNNLQQQVNPTHLEPLRLQQQVQPQRVIVAEQAGGRNPGHNGSTNAPAPKGP
jgi:hypothetical protein